MDNGEQKKSISELVIAAAKSGKLKMRPKWHFVLRAVLWLAGTMVAALAVLYLFSLFFFIARETGIWVAPIFGWRGILIFLVSIPWLLVLAVLFFIVILEILVRRYSFAYRLPLLYSAIALLLVVVVGSIVVAGTPLHGMLSHCSRRCLAAGIGPEIGRGPPCGTGFYRDLGPRRFDSIHKGVIGEISETEFVILTASEKICLL